MTIDQHITSRPATHVLAVASLVLSILGMLPILPVVGSIAGIITGIIAKNEIRSKQERYTGEGTAKAGIILGVIGIVLAVVVICGFALYFFPVYRVTGSGPAMVITVQP